MNNRSISSLVTVAAVVTALGLVAVPASAATATRVALNGRLIPAGTVSVAFTDTTSSRINCYAASHNTNLIVTNFPVRSGDSVQFDMYRKSGCGDWNSGASFGRVVPDNVGETWNVN